jgi:hypothetical protein
MSPNTRLIVGIVVIELLLAGLWFWLAGLAAKQSNHPEAQVVIGQTIGGAMGLVFALGLVIFFVRRSRQ